MNKVLGALSTATLLFCHLIYAQDKPLQFDFSPHAGSVQFRAIGHPSALHVVGKGPGPDGKATVQAGVVSANLKFSLAQLDSGIEVRDHHMKEKYLEVGKYPDAELVITKLRLQNDFSKGAFSFTGVPFSGTLKLHGASVPINGTVDLKWDGASTIDLNSQFSIKLTDFGIQIPTFSGITIADEVQITVISQPKIVKDSLKAVN